MSDAEIRAFADAMMAARIAANGGASVAEQEAALIDSLGRSGLSQERFLQIGKAVEADPALKQRVEADLLPRMLLSTP